VKRALSPAEEALMALFPELPSEELVLGDDVDEDERQRRALTFAELGLATAPLAPRPVLRDRLLKAALGHQRLGELRGRLAALFALDEGATSELVSRMNRPDAWLDGPLPGLSLMPLERAGLGQGLPAGSSALLVRLEPNAIFPEHQHFGDERMLILEGGLSLRDGATAAPTTAERGALVVSASGSRHVLRALADADGEECIAAVRIDGERAHTE